MIFWDIAFALARIQKYKLRLFHVFSRKNDTGANMRSEQSCYSEHRTYFKIFLILSRPSGRVDSVFSLGFFSYTYRVIILIDRFNRID